MQSGLEPRRSEPGCVGHAAETGELVEPVVRCVHRRVDRAPVAHDKSLEAPIMLQDFVQQVIVLASPAAVDEIVRAHDRTGLAPFQREFEREQVRLPHRLGGDRHIERRAECLLVVHGIMLDRRNDVIGLNAVDQRPGHHSGK